MKVAEIKKHKTIREWLYINLTVAEYRAIDVDKVAADDMGVSIMTIQNDLVGKSITYERKLKWVNFIKNRYKKKVTMKELFPETVEI
jgi:hypothetical protein